MLFQVLLMLVKRIAEYPHIDQQLVDKTNHSLPFHEVTQYFGLKYTQGLHGEKKKKGMTVIFQKHQQFSFQSRSYNKVILK